MEITLSRKTTIIVIGLIILFVLLLTVGIMLLANKDSKNENTFNIASCLPAFRDGGGPYYKSGSPFREKITPDDTQGSKLRVEGRVLNSDCTNAVSNAVIDIWQANESGEYQDEWYRGQVKTDSEGRYKFETIIPKGYGEGTGYRPPHIHFKVFVDGREIVTSQMFFSDVKGKLGFEDEYIIPLEEKDGGYLGNYNIVLPDYP